jgi:hypothetical protein
MTHSYRDRCDRDDTAPIELARLDCTLEMRQPGWAHFAGKGLQSEAKEIRKKVSADGC